MQSCILHVYRAGRLQPRRTSALPSVLATIHRGNQDRQGSVTRHASRNQALDTKLGQEHLLHFCNYFYYFSDYIRSLFSSSNRHEISIYPSRSVPFVSPLPLYSSFPASTCPLFSPRRRCYPCLPGHHRRRLLPPPVVPLHPTFEGLPASPSRRANSFRPVGHVECGEYDVTSRIFQ